MCQQPASSLYNVKDVAKDAPRKTRFTVGGKLLLAAVVTGSVSALAAHVLAQEEGMLKGAQRLHGRVAPLLVDALHHVQRLGGIRGALLLLLMQVGGFLFMVPTSPLSRRTAPTSQLRVCRICKGSSSHHHPREGVRAHGQSSDFLVLLKGD
mmetsp:Transcript_5145/g.9931  ORF Transcript_5145/g.9931 Transcript_5145/m.9931 type:complete len:152 (-) Transcript_5145:310-765(-)